MVGTLVRAFVPVQPGILKEFHADFASSGELLVAHMDPVIDLPDSFTLVYEGAEFRAVASDDGHKIDESDLIAFTGMAFA